jgi:hypothetical protein
MDKNGLLPKLQTNSTQLPPVSTDRKNFYEGHIATWNSIIKIIETIEHCYTDGRELEGDFSSQSAVLLEVSRLKRSLRQLTNNRTHIVLSRHCEADGNPALPGAIDELLTLK